MFEFESYVNNPPKLHSWDGGKTFNSGGFDTSMLRGLQEIVSKFNSPRIVETGVGNTTILFLTQEIYELITIAPDQDVWERTIAYCNTWGLNIQPLRKIVGFSEEVLPQISAEFRNKDIWIDLALIDGGHSWPTTFVDLCYMNFMLRKSGILIIDDVQLYAVNEMARYLSGSPDYRYVGRLGAKTAIFEKVSHNRLFTHWSKYLTERDSERSQLPDPHNF